jgi:hypothetical protein
VKTVARHSSEYIKSRERELRIDYAWRVSLAVVAAVAIFALSQGGGL